MTKASDTANILKQPFVNTLGTSNYRAGVNAGDAIASGGNYNVTIGDEAGTALTTADQNVAVGFNALTTDTLGNHSTAIGYQALTTQNFSTATDSNSTAVGYNAGASITTGAENTIIGALCGDALTVGNRNAAVGSYALTADTKGDRNVAVGYNTLADQNFTTSTDVYNTGVGYNAGGAITTGFQNTIVGGSAGDALTDADRNVAIGYVALSTDTLGGRSTAVGYAALGTQNFTSATDTYNTAIGYSAGVSVTTGTNNTFIGGLAGDGTDDGGNNTAVGQAALSANCGDNNTAIGYRAGVSSTGNLNTFIGNDSGYAMTSGTKNTILGRFDGNSGGLDIRTSSNNIVLSDGDGEPHIHIHSGYTDISNDISASSRNGSTSHVMHQTAGDITAFLENSHASNPYGLYIHFSGAAPDDNSHYFLACQDSSATRIIMYADGDIANADNSFGGFSDEKLKEQIKDASSQWDDIKALKVRKFKMKDDVAKGDNDAHWRLGVVAQEVETAGMKGLVKDNPDLDPNTNEDLGTTTKTVKYSILYMKAVKALQEAMTRIETLEAEVKALKDA